MVMLDLIAITMSALSLVMVYRRSPLLSIACSATSLYCLRLMREWRDRWPDDGAPA